MKFTRLYFGSLKYNKYGAFSDKENRPLRNKQRTAEQMSLLVATAVHRYATETFASLD